jgi:hypothetical protein
MKTIEIKRLVRKDDTFARISEKKNELRKGNILKYKGWTITAVSKYGKKDNRIWITAKKDNEKIVDDMLVAIFNVIIRFEKTGEVY